LIQFQLAQQPLKKTTVFEIAILAVQVLPKVPVGGVKQAQGGLRYKIGDGRGKNEGGERGESLLAKGRECRRQKSAGCCCSPTGSGSVPIRPNEKEVS
jgi:hypothetical protein